MRRTVLPRAAVLAVALAAMLAALVALATPAYPQTVVSDLAADAPRPPEYEVDEDGTLVIGGDVLIPCYDVGRPSDPSGRGTTPEVEAGIEQERREGIRACQAAGFDTAGDLPASASASSNASATASPVAEEAPVATTPEPAAAATTLPETGGPALLLLPAAGLLLAAGLAGLRAAPPLVGGRL